MGLVSEHPKMVEHAEEDAALARARQAHGRRVEPQIRHDQEAMQCWQQEQTTALAEGREPPPQPESTVSDADRWAEAHVFMPQQQELRSRRQQIVKEIAGDIEAAAVDRQAQLLAEAEPHVQALLPLAEQFRDLAADLAQVRTAIDGRSRPVAPKDIDVAFVVAAVLGANTLAAAEPSPQHGPVSSGDVPATARQVGGPGSSGMTTTLPEPPEFYRERVARGRGREI